MQPMMKTLQNNKEGFTIAEVVITTLLVLLMSIPLARISYSSVRNTQFALQATEAMALAQAKLERFYYEANAYGTSLTSTNTTFQLEVAAYDAIASGTETQDVYTLTWSVNEVNQTWSGTSGISTVGACKIIDLEVKWNLGSSSKDSTIKFLNKVITPWSCCRDYSYN